MATVNPTITKFGDNIAVFTWTPLTSTNVDGAPIPEAYADYADRTVHILGTFDSATVVWQGSNENVDASFLTLTDPQGNAVSKTSAGIEGVLEGGLFQRPKTSGGGGSQAVKVICVCRRNAKR